jgi:twitching motility protein PilI
MRSPFDILEAYERRSLKHAVQLPEREFSAELWRGVGYRIGKRRLVSDFREVVEMGNLRGNLFPVIDLKFFLEGQYTSLSEGQRVLIVRQAGGDVALTIDELFGQRSFSPHQTVEPGVLAQGRYRYFVENAYHADGHDWGVFSLALLSRTPEFRHAAA